VQFVGYIYLKKPVPEASRSRASVGGRSLAGIAGLNPKGASMSVVRFVCCQVEVSAWSLSLVQWNPIECGVSECDREAPIIMRLQKSRGTSVASLC
jgi:hypothetical protein